MRMTSKLTRRAAASLIGLGLPILTAVMSGVDPAAEAAAKGSFELAYIPIPQEQPSSNKTPADPKPAPPPAQDRPPKNNNPGSSSLKPDESTVKAFFTGLAAIKYCYLGDEKKVGAVGEAYGLRPESIDPNLARSILSKIEGDAQKDRQEFCQDAWEKYGPRGRAFKGLLSAPGTADAADWFIEPIPIYRPTACQATRWRGKTFSDYVALTLKSHAKNGVSDWRFTLYSPEINLPLLSEIPVSIDVGGRAHSLPPATTMDENEMSIGIASALRDSLAKTNNFVLKFSNRSYRIPFAEGSEIFRKLEACAAANDAAAQRR